MSYKTAMLMTVGISLLENVSDRIHNNPSIREKVKQEYERLPSKEQITLGIKEYYQYAYPNFQEQLQNSFRNLSNVEFPCAEIESFCYWLQEGEEVNLGKIILLPTATNPARKCAEQIEKILKDAVFSSPLVRGTKIGEPSIERREIPLLLHRVEDAQEFTRQLTQDIARFLEQIDKIVKDLHAEGFERIIINITGGYKVLVAIFASFGFVRQDTDVQVIYKHEHAEFLADVPPLPVTWDLKLFDEYRSLLKEGRSNIGFEPPSKLRVMFRQMRNEWERTPFAQVLQEIYETDRLRRFGIGARLMRWFQDISFKEKLEKGIARWEHIWIGDQIPEAVEHSRGHSIRLLECASDLLEPKFCTNPNFMSDKELYLLICCLWLHDIGHTGLEFDVPNTDVTIPVALFPSLVRRWHNFLSYELICSGDYLSCEEREAVALLSKYHRGKLPLLEEERPRQDKKVFPRIPVEPLEKLVQGGLSFSGEIIPKERALMLCALLRVIDGCDLQSDRVIDESYWIERRQRTKAEVDYLWKRLNQRWDLLDLSDDSYREELEKTKKILYGCYNDWKQIQPGKGWEEAQKIESRIDNDIEPVIMRLIGATAGIKVDDMKSEWNPLDSMQKEILFDLLSLIDSIAFKMRQEAHFLKHSRVELVYITGHDDKYRFNMIFNEKLETLTSDQKCDLAKEIWKEITQGVQKVLGEVGIKFEGVFSDGKLLYPCEEERQ